jgi:ribonuclease HII
VPSFELEQGLHSRGFSLVAGIDEAGRGPLAGPVVAAAVVLPPELFASHQRTLPLWLGLVDDSKRLSAEQRQAALEHIRVHATAIGVGVASALEIDAEGIVPANKQAMLRAVDALSVVPEHLIIDFVKLPECGIPFEALVHGDGISYSVAAASIVAKVTRDGMMEEADARYPGYGFARHKGYGTLEHRRRLELLGPCPIHRRSFAPVRIREGLNSTPAENGTSRARPRPALEGAG